MSPKEPNEIGNGISNLGTGYEIGTMDGTVWDRMCVRGWSESWADQPLRRQPMVGLGGGLRGEGLYTYV